MAGGAWHHLRSGKLSWRIDIWPRPSGRPWSMPELAQGGPTYMGRQEHPWGSGKYRPNRGGWNLTPYLLEKAETDFPLSKKTELSETNISCCTFCHFIKCWSSIYSTSGQKAWVVSLLGTCLASLWPWWEGKDISCPFAQGQNSGLHLRGSISSHIWKLSQKLPPLFF